MKSEERNSALVERDDFGVRGLNPEVIERLRLAIREAGGNKAVSEKSGVPLSTLNGAIAGKNQPRVSAMAAIASATGRSLDWLMMLSDTPSPAIGHELPDVTHIERLAFAGSAGSGSLVIEEAAGTSPLPSALLRRLHLRPEHARMLESSGDSMLPTIADGDPLLIDVSPDARSHVIDNKIYAFTLGNEAFLKRLRREPGQLMMVSDNAQLYPARPIPAGEHFRIVGRVRWGAREL
ncbi:helix-turn-helix domain-containing protein [Ancylobacter aquaticus]|nr:helix-turn-helix domain-containing protein [Ancylobacter aquaticus]